MSVIGLRVGPFEVSHEASVPEPGQWYKAVRSGMTRRQPAEALIRLLPPDAPAEARQQLQREFENLRSLDDPRIPTPIAFYEGLGALAIASVDGTPLDLLVEDRRTNAIPITPSTLLDLGLEVAEALQHAHHKGRWHGHLTPRMVVLGADGHLWVWGFGPGAAAEPPAEWMPPERARGQIIGAATDQWSLGALLAALITGAAPWRSADPLAEARKGDPEGILAPVEAQWPAFARLLRRMLDPHPDNRFPSLQPVRQELLALARRAGGSSERHKLGATLAERHAPQPESEEEPVSAPVRINEAPSPDAPAPATLASTHPAQDDPPSIPGEAPKTAVATPPPPRLTPAPAPPRATPAPAPRRTALPEELMPVVHPFVDEEVPVARVGRRPDSATPAPPPVRLPLLAAAPTFDPDRAPTETADDRAPTEMFDDRAATEMIDDRQATEMLEDRQGTEMIGELQLDPERETTEMVEVSDFHHALVQPLDEPIDDPISTSRESIVRIEETPLGGAAASVLAAPPEVAPAEEKPVPAPKDKLDTFPVVSLPTADADEEDAEDQRTVQYDAEQLMTVLEDIEHQPQVARTPVPVVPTEAAIEERRPTMVPIEGESDGPSQAFPRSTPGFDEPTIGGTNLDAPFFRRTDPGEASGPVDIAADEPAPPLPPDAPSPRIVRVAPWLAAFTLLALAVFTLWHFLH